MGQAQLGTFLKINITNKYHYLFLQENRKSFKQPVSDKALGFTLPLLTSMPLLSLCRDHMIPMTPSPRQDETKWKQTPVSPSKQFSLQIFGTVIHTFFPKKRHRTLCLTCMSTADGFGFLEHGTGKGF